MAMFTAYFDASGKAEDRDIMVIAGFVSSEKKWLRFEREWAALLDAFHIAPPFHCTDYVAAKKPPYDQFHRNDALRDDFEKRAIRIIKATTHKPVSVGLMLSEARAVAAEYYLPVDFDPYNACGTYGAKCVREWAARHSNVERVEYVFEAGDGDIGNFSRAFERKYGTLPIFHRKAQHLQFQAADILAWRHARQIRDHTAGKQNRREAFASLYTRTYPMTVVLSLREVQYERSATNSECRART